MNPFCKNVSKTGPENCQCFTNMGNLHKKIKKALAKIFKSLYYENTKTIKLFSRENENRQHCFSEGVNGYGFHEGYISGMRSICRDR